MELQHLLVLCCYGGQPFVDFHLTPAHSSTQQIDPTDWQASDIAGYELIYPLHVDRKTPKKRRPHVTIEAEKAHIAGQIKAVNNGTLSLLSSVD
ncbi:unnamed protein product [Haemonchus placei]|uniref:Transposase n=1 Tax=Haemonchus placei TaxID=6290 RepID=A0A0N4X9M7_HAEPC|nr:unnamed protein product [Haemonchus placei]